MTLVRIATKEDKEAFKELWKICFDDTEIFIDWFFQNRFLPEYCICLEVDGSIVSCMQAYPLSMKVRNHVVPSAMLAGVSTHPDFQKKGYMKEIFSFMMNHLQKKGILLAPHTPDLLTSYFGFGHFPVCNANMFTIENSRKEESICSSDYYDVPIVYENLGGLYDCYLDFSKNYSGTIYRSMADFTLKAMDYAVDSERCMAYVKNNEVLSYCFYYQNGNEILISEVVSRKKENYTYLLNEMSIRSSNCIIKGKLPSDIGISSALGSNNILQKSVCGGINLPYLLGVLGKEAGYSIKINDEVIENNNGTFDINGEKTGEPPDIEISAGALTQFLFGYTSLKELKIENKVIINNDKKAEELCEIFPIVPCYTIDEY